MCVSNQQMKGTRYHDYKIFWYLEFCFVLMRICINKVKALYIPTAYINDIVITFLYKNMPCI